MLHLALALVPLLALSATASPVYPRADNAPTSPTANITSSLPHTTPSGSYFAFGTHSNSFTSGLSSIVVFGDSLSDDGSGAFVLSGGTIPPPIGYPNRTYSNGYVYPTYMGQRLGLNVTSYAVGGATTFDTGRGPKMLNPTTNVTSVVPPTLTQLGRYLNSTNSVSASTLYIIFTGGNDFLGGYGVTGLQSAKAVQGGVDALLARGAEHILLVNLFAIAAYPFTTQLYDAYNTLFSPSSNYSSTVAVSDLYSASQIFRSPDYSDQFGFDPARINEACMPRNKFANGTIDYTKCADVTPYYGWDGTHPTTRGHSLLASVNLATLLRVGWAKNAV